jgi:hypothetical protein
MECNAPGQVSAAVLVGWSVVWEVVPDVSCNGFMMFPIPQPESKKSAMIGSREMLREKRFIDVSILYLVS